MGVGAGGRAARRGGAGVGTSGLSAILNFEEVRRCSTTNTVLDRFRARRTNISTTPEQHGGAMGMQSYEGALLSGAERVRARTKRTIPSVYFGAAAAAVMSLLLRPPSLSNPLPLRQNFSAEFRHCKPLLFSTTSGRQWYYRSKNITRLAVDSRISSLKEPPLSNPAALLARGAHKYFDQAVITARAGDGGHGAILSMPNQKNNTKSQGKHEKEKRMRSSYKSDSDGSLILPMGGHGGDVVLYVDEGLESLLE